MMNRIIGIALIVIGGLLAYYGFQETESPAGELEEAITGSPSDRSLGMIVGGVLVAAVGGGLLIYRGK